MSVSIYTSYYSSPKLRELSGSVKTASISNSKPAGFPTTYDWKNLSPRWEDVDAYKHGHISFAELAVRYTTALIGRFGSKEEVRNYILNRIGPDSTIVLLCWEKDETVCHRRILGELLGEDYKGEL